MAAESTKKLVEHLIKNAAKFSTLPGTDLLSHVIPGLILFGKELNSEKPNEKSQIETLFETRVAELVDSKDDFVGAIAMFIDNDSVCGQLLDLSIEKLKGRDRHEDLYAFTYSLNKVTKTEKNKNRYEQLYGKTLIKLVNAIETHIISVPKEEETALSLYEILHYFIKEGNQDYESKVAQMILKIKEGQLLKK